MSLIVKPLNANLTKGKDHIFLKKSPYLAIQVGNQMQKTTPDKNSGNSPHWSQQFTFHQLGPTLRLTLLDKNSIGHDDVLGEGNFDLTPAYINPYIPDTKQIDITSNGVIFARVNVSIQYQGEAMNTTSDNLNEYNRISSLISTDMSSMLASKNTPSSNIANMNSQNYPQNIGNQEIKFNPIPISVPVVVERAPMSVIPNNSINISQLGYSHLTNGVSKITTIQTVQTSRIPVTYMTTTIKPVITEASYRTPFSQNGLTPPKITTTTTIYRKI